MYRDPPWWNFARGVLMVVLAVVVAPFLGYLAFVGARELSLGGGAGTVAALLIVGFFTYSLLNAR